MALTPYCASLQMSTLAVLTSAQLSTSCSPSLRSPRAMFVKPPLRPPPLPFLRHSSEPSHLSLTVVQLGGSANGCQCFCTPLKLALTRSRGRPVLAGESITGVIFEPFEELKKSEVSLVPAGHDQSLARQKYTDVCETAINTQINVEYNASYAYHSLFAYFDRDNVALKGFAKFFKESSEEEKKHAEKLMKYQNKRGGKVKLLPIVMPLTDFDHHEKGDALYAMELALSLEKLTNEKLLNLHNVAQNCNDAQMTNFVQNEFLGEQQLKRSLDMSLSSEDWAKAMEFGISIKCFSMKEVMDKLYF